MSKKKKKKDLPKSHLEEMKTNPCPSFTEPRTLRHLCAALEVLSPHLAGLGIQGFLESPLVLYLQRDQWGQTLEAQEGQCHHGCRESQLLQGDRDLLLIQLNPEVKREETLSADIPMLPSMSHFSTICSK